MILYPAIDLMDGRCVRLAQGRFEDPTVYDGDPRAVLQSFASSGASWAHVVDLDGARAGAAVQHALLQELSAGSSLRLQVAGGIRGDDDLRRLFDAGASRAVVGSLAVRAPALVHDFFKSFGSERIALALDVRWSDGEPFVTADGWRKRSVRTLWEVAALFPQARHLLITDVERDGMLGGPNLDLVKEAVVRLPGRRVQASGGVSSIGDLAALKRSGAAAAIVGKALFEKRFTLEEALDRAGA